MSADEWNKQDWIKDILAKSGTEIMEINDDRPKDIRKMVYYPALPLIVKSEIKQSQLCSTLSNVDSHLYPNAINIQQQQQLLQQQQQHHQILSNTLPSSPTPSSSSPSNQLTQTMLITQNQTFPNNIKLEHNDHHQHQQQQQQQQQHQHQLQQSIHIDQPINSTHTKLTFKCEQCNMIFGSKSAHTSHMKSHSSTTTASMQDNNNYQSSSSSISPVMPTNGQVPIGGSDPYQCNVCKKTFAVPARLIRHYRTHTGERPFECEFCHKMFSVKENLQVHRRIHTKERPYKCEVCGRAFEHSGKLHRHMRIHTGERPHKCSVCNKTFIQSGQLVIHMRTHTGEKPYKCPVEGCGKGFTCSKQLKVHSRTHTGEKPYHCDICFRDFGYNHVLKLHRVQHYGSKCYKCTICDETFKSKKEMEAHIKGHANEIPDDDNDTEQQQQQQAQPQTQQPQQQPEQEQEQEQQQPQQTQSQPPRVKKGSTIAINTPALSPVATLPSVVAPPVTASPGQSVAIKKEKPIYTSYELLLPAADVSKSRDPIGLFPDTPIESSSSSEPDPNTDNCEDAFYYNMYKRFDTQPEQQIGIDYSMNHNRATINPALLAAACIASRRNNCESPKRKMSPPQSSNISSLSPLSPISTSLHVTTSPSSPQPIVSMEIPMEISNEPNPNEMVEIDLSQKQSTLRNEPQNSFPYEPLTVMRQQGYFAPAPVAEYRPSLKSANDIVRQVEAAIAGAEPLLTPPRSSTESPDRSSSPESDSMMMADRDMMTLPLRKRKLYLKDNQTNDVSPVMRMSSVIQYARAS